MSFTTPILFLVFNRPDTTKKVFESIQELKPLYLYIAADGPREGNTNDEVKCSEVITILSNINWPCQVATLYRKKNLGCRQAVSEAITWFFNQVEEGIVIEDDILPDRSFFQFCADMLDRYRHEQGVMHIAGFNLLGKWKDDRQSYHFSYFGTIWGWATWRRSWKFYDVNIKHWGNPKIQEKILNTYFPSLYRENRKLLYDKLYNGEIDTWDYQWTFSRLLQNGLSIIPARNLTINIGFDSQATHTRFAPEWAPKKIYTLEPPFIYYNSIAPDKNYETKHLKITNTTKKSLTDKLRYISIGPLQYLKRRTDFFL